MVAAEWANWLAWLSIIGGWYGFGLLALRLLSDVVSWVTEFVHLGQPCAADASSHDRKGI